MGKSKEPPAWIHDGRQVWYLPHMATDTKYAGVVSGEPSLCGETWCVRLTDMDNSYALLHPGKRTVAAAVCDRLRPRSHTSQQEEFERHMHELVGLGLMVGHRAYTDGSPEMDVFRKLWWAWVQRLPSDVGEAPSDVLTNEQREYWINEAYKLMRAGSGNWKKSG